MKYIHIIISILVFNVNYAHKNVQLEFKKGKITLITSTSTYNEEINKSLILAEYADILLDSLGYKKDMKILNFQSNKKFLKSKYDDNDGQLTFFRVNLELLDIKKFLNFIHYIIVNEKIINLRQPVDSKNLKESYELVDRIISIKMKRPNEVKELDCFTNYSYYFKDNNYYFHKLNTEKEVDIYNINNFKQIHSVTSSKFLVFLNDHKFDLVEENKKTSFKLSFEDDYSTYYRMIYINEKYSYIQSYNRDKLILLDLNNHTIIEDYYSKF